MTEQELRSVKAPFRVKSKHDGHTAVVVGFAESDPLDVTGGWLPAFATAYFEGGGWLLAIDLMRNFDLTESPS